MLSSLSSIIRVFCPSRYSTPAAFGFFFLKYCTTFLACSFAGYLLDNTASMSIMAFVCGKASNLNAVVFENSKMKSQLSGNARALNDVDLRLVEGIAIIEVSRRVIESM